jgi:hypothetical protein
MDDLVTRLRYTAEHGLFTAVDEGMYASPQECLDALETQAAEIATLRLAFAEHEDTAQRLWAELAGAREAALDHAREAQARGIEWALKEAAKVAEGHSMRFAGMTEDYVRHNLASAIRALKGPAQ